MTAHRPDMLPFLQYSLVLVSSWQFHADGGLLGHSAGLLIVHTFTTIKSFF